MRRRTPITIDVYGVMEVAPNASASEIKSAYRRLAHAWHPDVSEREDAEERFKLLNAAYDVLKDPTLRAEYDLAHFSARPAPPPPPEPARPAAPTTAHTAAIPSKLDVHVQVELTYAEAISGVSKEVTFRRRVECPACSRIRNPAECRTCRELRWVEATDLYNWSISPGATGDTVLRVPRTGDRLGGKTGDLFLRVALLKQPGLTRKGVDFHVERRVRSVTLQRGGRVAVEGPSGKLSVVVPAGTRSGAVLRLVGAGLPHAGGRGSIHVRLWEERA